MSKVGLRITADFLEKRGISELGSPADFTLTNEQISDFSSTVSKFMKSQQDELVFLTLKIVHLCSKNSIELNLQKELFSRDVITILTQITALNTDLIQIIFSLLTTTLFSQVFKFTFIDFQIIFHVLSEYLYISDEVTAPILFLKKLINEKVIKTEIYDLIGKLFDVFYETQNEFFERESKECILLFLQHFVIDDLLLVKYTIDLMKHVDLEGEFKRGSVIEFLAVVFERFGVKFCAEFVR